MQFFRYNLNITNFDTLSYPDTADEACTACIASKSCSLTDCLSTTVASVNQNKLMSLKVHVVIGYQENEFHMVSFDEAQYYSSGGDYYWEFYDLFAPKEIYTQATFDVMPTGCNFLTTDRYEKG